MKIHVSLKAVVDADPEAKAAALYKVEQLGVREINLKRFQRYGVITGEIESLEAITALEALPEVFGVEMSSDDRRILNLLRQDAERVVKALTEPAKLNDKLKEAAEQYAEDIRTGKLISRD